MAGKSWLDDIDYSQPYEVSLENFRKKHGNIVPFLSKDQYKAEAAKKGAVIQKQESSPDMVKGDIDYSQPYEVSLEDFRKKNGNAATFAPKEVYEKTKDDLEIQRIDDTRAIGATKEELDDMLQNGMISRDAYEKQIAALNTPEVQEAMAIGEKKADETVWDSSNRDETVAETVSDAVTPKENDTPEVVDSKNKYNKSMMSIWDAYRAGEIDKETAGYFTIDAIATLAKNLGRSIGNVGAQFSGGTIDNGHDESKWGQRQNAMLSEEIQKEKEGVGSAASRQAESESLDNQAKRIRNAYTPAQLEHQIEMFKDELEISHINLDMAHSKTDLINFIKKDPDYTNSPFKMGLVAYLTQQGAAGAANDASKTLSDAINWILTIAK